MPVSLSVSDVRREIYRQSGAAESAGDGEPSWRFLGTVFHQLFAGLVSDDPRLNLEAALHQAEDASDSWGPAIIRHAYCQFVGPAIADRRVALQNRSSEILTLWEAVGELSHWLADLCSVIATQHRLGGPEAAKHFIEGFVSAEQRMECELRRPDWSDSVRLTGIADAVIRIPNRSVACLVEFKLGRTAPETDLAQACLYHRILRQLAPTATAPTRPQHSLAVVSFLPQCHERLLSDAELGAAQDALEALIGRLAGVVGGPVSIERATTRAAIGTGAERSAVPESDFRKPQQPSPTQPVTAPGLSEAVSEEHRAQSRAIVDLYREFRLDVEPDGDPIPGPTFVRHRLRPGRRVTVRQLEQRSRELKLRLGLESAPIISMDRETVTIDLQRPDRRTVLYSDIRPLLQTDGGSSLVPIGIDLGGKLKFADLSKPENCHLLVAGTTGSGKSEWLRTAIAGLIDSNTPETLQFVLIDPKRNAFLDLKDSPFLRRPLVFPDSEDVVEVLDALVDEMERRYRVMEGASTIDEYMNRPDVAETLPRIVCICDEYADLISQDTKERRAIEQRVKRIGFKARAAGIHLILATQDPRRDVVSGTIKANMPTRVALKTAEEIESRTVLSMNGAESLLGRGDLLFKDIGPPRRLQAAYLPPEDREAIFAGPAPRRQTP